MNKVLYSSAFIFSALLSCVIGGCNESSREPLHTGTVNSTVIIQRDSRYQELAAEYTKERMAAAEQVQKLVKQHSKNGILSDSGVYKKLLQIQEEVESKWQKKTGEYLESKRNRMRQACERIAAEKQLDLVVVDSGDVPTVEFGAHDITENVLAVMGDMESQPAADQSAGADKSGGESSKAPAAESSQAPEAEK